MRRALPPLLFGVILGAAAGWFLARPSPSDSDLLAPRSSLPAPSTLPPWAWRDSATPPALAPDLIGPAIAAWRGLRSPDGTPASFTARADALRNLLARLPAEGFPRLLAALAPADTEDDRLLRQLAFDIWIETDAPAAARWAALAGPDLRSLARQALKAWTALDPAAAAECVCALRDADAARELAPAVLAALAATDPARALALAGSRDDAFRAATLPALFENLAKADPAAALHAHGAAIWADGTGFEELRAPLRAWARRDPAAAFAWLAAQPHRYGEHQLGMWISGLAETPEERRQFASTLAGVPGVPSLADTIAWMIRRDSHDRLAETIAWLDTTFDPLRRRDILLSLAGSRSADHPEQCLPFALALPPSQNRTRALGQTLAEWNKIDSAAALAWAREQNDPAVSAALGHVQGALLAEIARTEPQTALAEWNALADPRAQKTAMRPIAEAWGKTDPAAALQWLNTQSPAAGTNALPHIGLLSSWAKKDPEPALRWAEAFLESQAPITNPWVIDHTLAALGGTGDGKFPRAQTADLYSKIHDPALRAKTLQTHVAEWLTKDPAAAKTWLEKSSALTPEQAAALLAPAGK